MSQVVSRNLMISTQYAQSLILGMTLQRETMNKTLWGQPIERYANQNFTKRQHFELEAHQILVAPFQACHI